MGTEPKTIRITKVQAGAYPEWVRNAWLGCEFPCVVGVEEILSDAGSITPKVFEFADDATEQEEPEYKITCFVVRRDIALTALRKKLPAAALWYCERNYLQPNKNFAFQTEDVEMVEAAASSVHSLR